MMKLRDPRIVGLCVLAVLAAAAIAASSASALPEWGQCEAKAGGKYTDADCTIKAQSGGGYEWRKGKTLLPDHFVSESGTALLKTYLKACAPGDKRVPACAPGETLIQFPFEVGCEGEVDTGELVGSKEVANVFVRFIGCSEPLFGVVCTTPGDAAGEIATNALKGHLDWIKKTARPREVGLLLEPEVPNGEFARSECGPPGETPTTMMVVGVGNPTEGGAYGRHGGHDGVISPITPVNTMTPGFMQQYTVNGYKNVPERFEHKRTELLEGYLESIPPGSSTMWSPAGEEVTVLSAAEEPTEIRAGFPLVWWVEGLVLTGTKAIEAPATVTSKFLALEFTNGPTVRCGKIKIKGGVIEGPKARHEDAEVWENCEVVEPGGAVCSIGSIQTSPLDARLVGSHGALKLRFKPHSGSEITSFTVSSPPCSPASYQVSGEMTCEYGTGVEIEAKSHACEFTSKSSGNKINGGNAHFTGAYEVKLATGENWSAY